MSSASALLTRITIREKQQCGIAVNGCNAFVASLLTTSQLNIQVDRSKKPFGSLIENLTVLTEFGPAASVVAKIVVCRRSYMYEA